MSCTEEGHTVDIVDTVSDTASDACHLPSEKACFSCDPHWQLLVQSLAVRLSTSHMRTRHTDHSCVAINDHHDG